MKKYLYFAAAAVVMVSACKKSNDFSQSSPLHEVDGTKVPIVLGSNVSARTTKGAGVVDEWTGEQNLYIFGFQRTPYTADAPADFSEGLIDGVRASAPADGLEGNIELFNRDVEAGWGYPFYYGLSEEGAYATYDFYGCYLDDANTEVAANPTSIKDLVDRTTNPDQITIDFTIDGTQDLMTAHANREDDCAAVVDEEGNPKVAANQAYSGWAARQGVKPNLVFEHALTQFKFRVKNKSGQAGNNLYLQELAFDSYTTGDLVIAAKDVTTMGVTNLDGYDDVSINYITIDEDGNANHGKELAKGGDFVECDYLIVTPQASQEPGEEYNHKVTLKVAQFGQKVKLDQDGNPVPKENGEGYETEDVYIEMDPLSFAVTPAMVITTAHVDGDKPSEENPETVFKKGYCYVVNISIYSWEKIEIAVELTEWQDGGHIDIDPDDEPSFV